MRLMKTWTTRSAKYRNAAVLVSAIFSAALLVGCGPEASAVGSVDRSFTVDGPVRLELSNGSGSSHVSVGPPGEVKIHAEFRVHAWPWDDPSQMLKDLVANPPFSQEGHVIHIGAAGWERTEFSADYAVTVPPDTEMRGISGSGNLEVEGIAGPASFTVGSGNVRATGIQKDVHAVVGSGNVTFTDAQGRIDSTAGSGEIVVRGAKGDVRARAGSGEINIDRPGANVEAAAGSGDIQVREANGDVRVHTSSGEITVDGNPAPTSYWDIRATSGDVTLHVPAGASFRFYAHTNSGNIHANVPGMQQTSDDRRDFEARMGDGKARVEIETTSGEISVH
jgi:Putative adhesin